MTLDCPVCQKKNIEEERCSQCGTDLSPLLRAGELPQVCYGEGLRLLEAGSLAAAVENLAAAAVLEPEWAEARCALGEAYTRKGLHGEALAAFDEALRLAPESEEARGLRAASERALAEQRVAAEQRAARTVRTRKLLWRLPAAAFLAGLAALALVQAVAAWIASSRDASAELAANVRNALASNPVAAGLKLDVSGRNRQVYVTGEAPDEARLHLAREIALRATGGRANTAGLKTAEPKPAPEIPAYTVRSGDSFWTIARRQYGTTEAWRDIEKANLGRLRRPGRLFPGERILLPAVTLTPPRSRAPKEE